MWRFKVPYNSSLGVKFTIHCKASAPDQVKSFEIFDPKGQRWELHSLPLKDVRGIYIAILFKMLKRQVRQLLNDGASA